jgi:GAF domain-containing protein
MPRGATAPPPKRTSGQFESAPLPVKREATHESAVLTPGDRASAEDIAEAVADIFDATQGLLMEGVVEPRRIAEALLDIALAHVPAESGSFYLADLNGHVLSFAAVRGPKAEAIRRGRFTVPVGQGIIGFCALEGICLRVTDMQKDPHYTGQIANAVGYVVKDTLCASAEKDGRLYGAIQLINAHKGFTAAHMEMLRYIGLTAAQLLERHFETA